LSRIFKAFFEEMRRDVRDGFWMQIGFMIERMNHFIWAWKALKDWHMSSADETIHHDSHRESKTDLGKMAVDRIHRF
jgi:hypothetical protein